MTKKIKGVGYYTPMSIAPGEDASKITLPELDISPTPPPKSTQEIIQNA